MSPSFQVDDPKAKQRYEKLASKVLKFQLESWEQIDQTKITESDIAKHFRAERLDAAEWYETLKTDEERWIRNGDAVDEKFNEKYRGLPEAIATDPPIEPRSNNHADTNAGYRRLVDAFIPIGVIIVGMIVTVVAFVARRRRPAH